MKMYFGRFSATSVASRVSFIFLTPSADDRGFVPQVNRSSPIHAPPS
jgi:hypothetical protein